MQLASQSTAPSPLTLCTEVETSINSLREDTHKLFTEKLRKDLNLIITSIETKQEKGNSEIFFSAKSNELREMQKSVTKRIKKMNLFIFQICLTQTAISSTYKGAEPYFSGILTRYGHGTLERIKEFKDFFEKNEIIGLLKKNEKFKFPSNFQDLVPNEKLKIERFEAELNNFEEEKLKAVDDYIQALTISNLWAVALKEKSLSTLQKFQIIFPEYNDPTINKKLNLILDRSRIQKLKIKQENTEYNGLINSTLALQKTVINRASFKEDRLKDLNEGLNLINNIIQSYKAGGKESKEYTKKIALYKFKIIQITILIDNNEKRIIEIQNELKKFKNQISQELEMINQCNPKQLSLQTDAYIEDELERDLLSFEEEQSLSETCLENQKESNVCPGNKKIEIEGALKYQNNHFFLNKKFQQQIVSLKEVLRLHEIQVSHLNSTDKTLLKDSRTDFYERCKIKYNALFSLIQNTNEIPEAVAEIHCINTCIEGRVKRLLESIVELQNLSAEIDTQFENLKKSSMKKSDAVSNESYITTTVAGFTNLLWGSNW